MKFLNAALLIVFLFVSVPYAEAATDYDDLELQLLAILEHLENKLPVEALPLSSEVSKDIILDGAGWIVASQKKSGRFRYEYMPYEGKYSGDDNIVRQAGTLYALAEVYRAQSEKDEAIATAIEDSIGYFAGLTKEAEGVGSCLRSHTKSQNCQSGATALALLGVLSYVEADSGQRESYNATITNYANFLLNAQLAEGGFSQNYNFGSGYSEDESPFYNGEALLALVHYYQHEPGPGVRKAIDDAFVHLKQNEFDPSLYLWMMAALKDMQVLWPNAEYVQYAKEFTDWRMIHSIRSHSVEHNFCAPTEGLVSAFSVLEGNISVEDEVALLNEVNYWLRKASRLQINAAYPYRISVGDNGLVLGKLTNPHLAHGGFLTGAAEQTQRIDFTQHCVSSFLQKFEDIDGQQL